MTETEARKAFNTANTELQAALNKYQKARTSLHSITGEFAGTDQALSLQFSSACAAPTDEASPAAHAVADC
jgi:hypothetical protein